ncbi:PRD domain-containing protein [Parageobacillus thermoglucosidasius]|uniref:PRD domain-containing protein n=1 Tax=Parageobacillus thermoglucosidasius TaxID=1426 RepID=UPI000B570F46|nr:PRD domain-containing protein [Parageobacillus thermoglucosidasius]OUM86707.1 MAG: hypothetical protein BAA00_17650 [Parageobacillus thermoglucosidasius]
MNKDSFTEEEKKLLEKSGDVTLCIKAYEFAIKQMENEKIYMTDFQRVSLLSHISGMVYRSVTGEKLFAIDHNLFAGISNESLHIAKKIKEYIGNLPEDEIYLLSIHFENAKRNSFSKGEL